MDRDTIDTELQEFAERLYAVSPLVLADRCDRCGESSQAFVRAYKTSPYREILFCGHHASRHEPELIANGWQIQDERSKINAKPMSGAPESALSVNED